jgi:MOSC domain-containing protein YiiM
MTEHRGGRDAQNGPMSASLTAVCLVHTLHPEPTNPGGRTAIDKRPVAGRHEVRHLGLVGDAQLDARNHGGPDAALYAYADEDAAWWSTELSREITPGLFGENLRVSGVDVTGAEIGERWRIGDAAVGVLVEVTSPRTPCATFQRRLGEKHWVKRFTDRGAPGAYLKVLAAGRIAAGDPVAVEHRPGHGVTIGDAFLRPEPATMRRLLDAERAGLVGLSEDMRYHANRAVARA